MGFSLHTSPITAAIHSATSPWLVFGVFEQFFRQLPKRLGVPKEDCLDHGHNAPTILLVPGFTHDPSSMSGYEVALREKYNVAYAPTFSWLSADTNTLIELLSQKIQTLHKNDSNGDISVIGHSLWGVLSVLMIAKNSKLSVHRIITLASPHGGVPSAKLLSVAPVLESIARPGEVYRGLGRVRGRVKQIFAVTTGRDSLVPPESQGTEHIPRMGKRTDFRFPEDNHLDPLSRYRINEILSLTGISTINNK